MLILHHLAPWHWAIGGAAIGLITLALQFFANRSLGVSTGFESLCSLFSRRPYFNRIELVRGGSWRLVFLGGLVVGGFLSSVLGGGWHPTWAAGMLDGAVGFGPLAKLAWMFAGGLLIGFGTRLAGGCTSGHGIFGISNFERGSLVATLAYMGAGIAMTNVLYRLVWS